MNQSYSGNFGARLAEIIKISLPIERSAMKSLRLSTFLLPLTLSIAYLPTISQANETDAGIGTAICSEPKGTSYNVGPDPLFKLEKHKFEASPDGYKDKSIVFIIQDSRPEEMFVTFGSSNASGIENFYGPTTTIAKIIKNHLNGVITAIEAPELSSVWMYSLYPENGMAFMSRHGRFLTGGAKASTFYMSCNFNNF